MFRGPSWDGHLSRPALLAAGPKAGFSRVAQSKDQLSISGCYPSLDYLLARRSYPRRASSLFTRRLGHRLPGSSRVGEILVTSGTRRTGSRWLSPALIPANRHPGADPDPGEPAPGSGCRPQRAGGDPRRPPANRMSLLGPEAIPARKPAAIPSCSADAARCGRLECPPARRERRTFETPEPPPELSSSGGLPRPSTRTDGLSSPLVRRCFTVSPMYLIPNYCKFNSNPFPHSVFHTLVHRGNHFVQDRDVIAQKVTLHSTATSTHREHCSQRI
jgi:hypothetical protein